MPRNLLAQTIWDKIFDNETEKFSKIGQDIY